MTEPSPPPLNPLFTRPGPHLVIPGFFGESGVRRFLDYAESHRDAFQESTVVSGDKGRRVDPSFRVSWRLTPIPELESMIRGRVAEVLDEVLEVLGCPSFEPSSYEIEMVAHGNGAFFKEHIDTITGSSDRRVSRVVTMVYYFCAMPPSFSGGQLRLHAIAKGGGPESYIDIAPVNDTALFFPSWFPHEVLPVVCESGRFMDSRFAINYWAHKGD